MKTSAAILLVATLPMMTACGQDSKPAAAAETVKDGVLHVNAAAARKLVEGAKEKKVIVLDVRTPEEFKAGHLKGAFNADFNGKEFAKAVAELDKEATVVVHCQAGGRSKRSLPKLKELGFRNLVHLDGGFGDWEAAGFPVEK
jgi:rhodanese-related sulfurtransferase